MNRQPVFTDIPILVSKTIEPSVAIDIYNNFTNALPISVFTSTDVSGSLIERVTVTSTGDTTYSTVTAKLIYLAIYDANDDLWNLYKTAAMPATNLNDTTPNPEIEWVFTGGILLPSGFRLGIAASTNTTVTNERGDNLSVTIEGSSYTSV